MKDFYNPKARAITAGSRVSSSTVREIGFNKLLREDLRLKAMWLYHSDSRVAILKTLLTDGTASMILYRMMQWSRTYRLAPLEMLFNKLNAVFGNCIIGRGADFGPGLVLIHSNGIVINGSVRGSSNIYIEHQVTIGAERGLSPSLGRDIFIGAGAKILGAVHIGDGARIGANAVVVHDVPPHTTAVGIPARVVRRRNAGHGTPGFDDARVACELLDDTANAVQGVG